MHRLFVHTVPHLLNLTRRGRFIVKCCRYPSKFCSHDHWAIPRMWLLPDLTLLCCESTKDWPSRRLTPPRQVMTCSYITDHYTDMPNSLPRPSAPYNDAFTRADRSADYGNVTSSVRELGGQATSAPTPVRREPLAFAGIRHRLEEDAADRSGIETRQSKSSQRRYIGEDTDIGSYQPV
jgi:hypothetical protein